MSERIVCAECAYWNPPQKPVHVGLRSTTRGQCRLHPPVLSGGDDPVEMWPNTDAIHWCGQAKQWSVL